MEEHPPSTIRIINNEAISPTEVRITMEMIVKRWIVSPKSVAA